MCYWETLIFCSLHPLKKCRKDWDRKEYCKEHPDQWYLSFQENILLSQLAVGKIVVEFFFLFLSKSIHFLCLSGSACGAMQFVEVDWWFQLWWESPLETYWSPKEAILSKLIIFQVALSTLTSLFLLVINFGEESLHFQRSFFWVFNLFILVLCSLRPLLLFFL